MFPLGFVSAIFPNKCFEEVIDFAAENSFAVVELMCWPKGKAERRYAGVTHIDADALDEATVTHILQYAATKKVGISALGYYPNPMDEDEEKRAIYITHLLKVITAAQKLGVAVVNTFIGRSRYLSPEQNFELFQKIWPPILQHAQSAGVKIAIENCPMYFTADEWPNGKNIAISPAVWQQMFEQPFAGNLGLNYDPSHLLWQQMNYLQPITQFSEKLFHIHLKDAAVDTQLLNQHGILAHPLAYHSPRLPGRGDINWSQFFTTLKSAGYTGPVVIEFEDKDFEHSEQAIADALIATKKEMERLLGHSIS
jgi:sugar phosphate isomerase/epimerase